MKSRFVIGILMLLSFAFPLHEAKANIDQLCLKQCVSNASSTSGCVGQCSFEVPVAPIKPSSSSHRVFTPVTPYGGGLVKSTKTITEQPSKDFPCFQQCLHDGKAYDLCNRSCAKSTTSVRGASGAGTDGPVNGMVDTSVSAISNTRN